MPACSPDLVANINHLEFIQRLVTHGETLVRLRFIYWQNVVSFESLELADHYGTDNKFTYTFHWRQTLLILCKRLNKV